MTTDNEITIKSNVTEEQREMQQAMRVAYAAAILASGSREEADAIMRRHGSDAKPHNWKRVSPSKQVACLQALEALATGGKKSDAVGLERLRPQAFANVGTEPKQRPTPPKSLDPVSIFKKWNAPKPTADE